MKTTGEQKAVGNLLEAQEQELHSRVNVGTAERVVSGMAGSALAAYGISRKSPAGAAMAVAGGALIYRGVSGRSALYHMLHINGGAGGMVVVEKSMTVLRPASDLYRVWRQFDNLPLFMEHLESVTVCGRRSHWVARAPFGKTVAWDAEITEEQPNELIVWKSLPGSEIEQAGMVQFTPASNGQGTVVRVRLEYRPTAGAIGALVGRMTGEEPAQQIREDLRRFKELMETGEIATVQGQPTGRPDDQENMPALRVTLSDLKLNDQVDEASIESFPASDPPGFAVGQSKTVTDGAIDPME